jgi:hypothetical protein
MSVAYWTAVAALIAGGCSWVYDADDLRGSGDGGVSVDADPEALFVAGLKPAMVLEGEGSAFAVEDEDLVRAIPIVLEGQNMTADTTFRLEGLGFDMEIEDIAVSGDGRFAAFALRVPIRDSGEDAVIAIQLIKGSEGQRPLLQVKGLDALVRRIDRHGRSRSGLHPRGAVRRCDGDRQRAAQDRGDRRDRGQRGGPG